MESDESHLVKVDPGGTFEQFLEQAEGRLGFRPAGVYLKGTRVLAVEDLEEDDQLTCCRVPRGAATPGPAAAPAAAAAASPAAAPAPVPGVLNVKVSSQDDDINLRLKLSTRLVKPTRQSPTARACQARSLTAHQTRVYRSASCLTGSGST
jgi:hypothetical protein